MVYFRSDLGCSGVRDVKDILFDTGKQDRSAVGSDLTVLTVYDYNVHPPLSKPL